MNLRLLLIRKMIPIISNLALTKEPDTIRLLVLQCLQTSPVNKVWTSLSSIRRLWQLTVLGPLSSLTMEGSRTRQQTPQQPRRTCSRCAWRKMQRTRLPTPSSKVLRWSSVGWRWNLCPLTSECVRSKTARTLMTTKTPSQSHVATGAITASKWSQRRAALRMKITTRGLRAGSTTSGEICRRPGLKNDTTRIRANRTMVTVTNIYNLVRTM